MTRRVEWTARLKRGINAGFLSLIVLMALACTDENVSRGQADGDSASQVDPEDHVYSIKVFVGSGDHQRLVEFLPGGYVRPSEGDEPSHFPVAGLALEAEGLPELEELALHEQAVIRKDDGSVIETDEQDELAGVQPGSTLLSLAAKACSRVLELDMGEPTARPPILVGPYPWVQANGYYGQQILAYNDFDVQDNFQSCDAQLAPQEVLLCAADKLAEIADSVGPIRWDIDYWSNATSNEDVTIEIPPQATQDRFIARDMALNTLASVAQVDLRHPGGAVWPSPPYVGNPDQTDTDCISAYALAAAGDSSMDPNGTEYDEDSDSVWKRGSVHHFGLDPYAPNGFVEAGKQRLRLKSNILAASARLVKKLVDDSVRDDLAGAERKRASAGDPMQGAKAYWGAPDTEEPVYNTIRHALQVLHGRLEVTPLDPSRGQWQSGGIFNEDPLCWGYLLVTDLIS